MTVTKTKAKPATKTAEKALVVYVGPTIPKTGLAKNTVLNNGIPQDAIEHVERCKEITKLIVPVTELANVRALASCSGTPEHTFYSAVSDYLAGGAK